MATSSTTSTSGVGRARIPRAGGQGTDRGALDKGDWGEASRGHAVTARINPTSQRRRNPMKVVIIGGVAGGASCAARLRRLDEKAEILLVGARRLRILCKLRLAYHVSGVIAREASLIVANEQFLRSTSGSTRGRTARQRPFHLRTRLSPYAPSSPARRPPSSTTSWCCLRVRYRFIHHCPVSIFPGSSRFARCPMRGLSENGLSTAPASWPG